MVDEKVFQELVEHRMVVCQSILKDRARQYATKDRLWNFKRAASIMGTPVPAAVVGMMNKHLVSVLDIAQGIRAFNIADIHEKFTDLHNYLYLLEAAIVEQNEQAQAREALNEKMDEAVNKLRKAASRTGNRKPGRVHPQENPKGFDNNILD